MVNVIMDNKTNVSLGNVKTLHPLIIQMKNVKNI